MGNYNVSLFFRILYLYLFVLQYQRIIDSSIKPELEEYSSNSDNDGVIAGEEYGYFEETENVESKNRA